jgi:MSHA biogenesis protein MshN
LDVFEMSLINKMLMDLEERRPEGEAFSPLQDQLRAVPEARSRVPRWLAMACAVPLCGAAAWIAYEHSASSAVAHVKEQAPVFHLRMSTGLDQLSSIPQNMNVSEASVQPVASGAMKFFNEVSQGPTSDESAPPVVSVTPKSAVESVSALNITSSDRRSPDSTIQDSSSLAALATVHVQNNAKAKDGADATAREEINLSRTRGHEKPPSEPLVQATPKADARPVAALTKQFRELTSQQHAENEYRRAANFIQQGKLSEAIKALEQSLYLDPQHIPAFQALLGILIDSKRHEEAIRRLQEKLHHERSYAQLAMTLARLQVDRGETKSAIDTLQKSLPHASHEADYQAFLAALYQRDGRNKESVELYMLALSKSPQNGIWWMGLGISLQALNRLPEARDAFLQAKENNLPSADLQTFVEQKLTQLQ